MFTLTPPPLSLEYGEGTKFILMRGYAHNPSPYLRERVRVRVVNG